MNLALVAAILAAATNVPDVTAAPLEDRDVEAPAAPADAPNALSPDPDKVGFLQGKIESLEEQFIENKAIVTQLAKLKVSGYVQARYTYLDAATPASTFFIRRGRLKTEYAGTFAGFLLQLDATNTGITLKDAEVSLTEPWTKKQLFMLTVGQTKWPFGYEVVQSSADREFPERTRVVQAFAPGERDRGAKVSLKYGPARAVVGVFDGNGTNNTGFVGKDNDNEKDIVGRVGADFGIVSFGVSGWWGKTLRPYDMSSGTASAFFPRNRLGLDAQVYLDLLPIGGTALKAEFITGHTYTQGGVEKFGMPAMGWYALLVQNILDDNQVGFRYDFFDPAMGVPNGVDPKDATKPLATNQIHTFGVMAAHWFDEVLRVSVAFELPLTWTGGKTDIAPKQNLLTVQLQGRF